jgi:hypothetical protein
MSITRIVRSDTVLGSPQSQKPSARPRAAGLRPGDTRAALFTEVPKRVSVFAPLYRRDANRTRVKRECGRGTELILKFEFRMKTYRLEGIGGVPQVI